MTGSRRLVLAGALALASGCVIVPPAVSPPAPLAMESAPVQPGPAYVWVPGHWTWRAGAYAWISGAWLLPPRPGYVWAPGHWVARGSGQVWLDAYWHSVQGSPAS